MRSIGKKNIKLVIAETEHAMAEGIEATNLETVVVDRLPSSLWDTWEMADQEIRRIIHDTLHRRR